MPKVERYQVNKLKFLLALGKVKSKTDLTMSEWLQSVGLSDMPYRNAKNEGFVTMNTLLKLREAKVDVSEFMKRDDFISLFGNE